MRYRVVLAVAVGLLIALPAAARVQDEIVSLSAGKTLRLKTVFDKDVKYAVTVSGVITLTVSNVSITIDPLFSYSGNCQDPSARTGVRLLNGQGIDVFSPFSQVPRPKCRSDHRYTFTLNDQPPRTGVLAGRVTAKNDITVNAARGDTATGAFKLVVKAEPPEPVATVLWGVDAHEKKGLVSAAHLTGRGLMETTKIKEGGFAATAHLLPAENLSREVPHAKYVYEGVRRRFVEAEITSGELIIQGADGSENERRSVRLVAEVVDSNMPGCPERTKTRRGARGKLILIHYPRGAPNPGFVNAFFDLPCGRVDESWANVNSDATIRIDRLKKKR